MNLKLNLKSLAGAAVLLAMLALSGASPLSAGDKVALGGYDTVAYFTQNKAAKGTAEFSAEYLGKTWHFASAKHRDLFKANPTKYAPQYGGYCAWGVGAKDDFFPSDPEVFALHGGKLYLNYNSGVAGKWNQNRAGFIKQGDANYAKSKKPVATEVND